LNEAPVNSIEIYDWCKVNLAQLIRATSPDIDTFSLESLKKTYRKELEQFDQGVGALFEKDSPDYKTRLADELLRLQSDKLGTIKALERFLCTGRGRLLVVVLDNCDKRDREEQLLMFQVAKWIQHEIRCLVVLPIRHITYENHRNQPPLDTALKDLIYRIEPPPFQKILQQRLSLVLSEAKSSKRVLSYHVEGKLIEFPVEKLEKFLRTIMKGLFDYEHYGRKIIIGLAGWNMRTAFELFLEFCRSGYISEGDIFSSQATDEPLLLSKGVVARVIMRTNHRYYDGDKSYTKNIFQCLPDDPMPDHFARYRILSWLKNARIENRQSGYRGYHKVGKLISDLVMLGSDEDILMRECNYLVTARCVIAEHLRTEKLGEEDLIAVTPAGRVHLQLARDFDYLAACAEDTWMCDEQLAGNICQAITQEPRSRSYRKSTIGNSALSFIRYLKQEFSYKPIVGVEVLPLDPMDMDFARVEDNCNGFLRSARYE
jgi:hypothetical protein